MSDDPLERLKQMQVRRQFQVNGTGPWTVVYSDWRDDDGNGGLFSAFSDPERRAEAVSDAGWDLHLGQGMPGFSQSYGDAEPETHYHRFGGDNGLEPLVILQEFHGALPEMLPQLAEEFRHYHNLWVSPDGTKLIKLNDDGTQYVAAEISAAEVRVRTSLLKQFQAGRQLDLLLFVDSVRYVDHIPDPDSVDYDTLDEEVASVDERTSFTAQRSLNGIFRKSPFSRFLGTKVMAAPEQRHAGVWPFDQEEAENYPDFIIGEDENGRPVRYTCDPDALANYFGKNPDAPHYLTPVFFRREVLQRYFEEPEKYSVTDGRLSCAHLWGVQIDNDHPDHVAVFLGDLGRDLPESERSHWLSQNVAPTSPMSATNIRRSFFSQGMWPEAPDLMFKYRYEKLLSDWASAFTWELFREPVAEDAHVLKRLRIPLNQSLPEFEGQVLNLAKLLVDALNDSGLDQLLPNKIKDERSLGKLKRWLEQEGFPTAQEDIGFLRKVQGLRSRAAAHRKGSDYADFLAAELGTDNMVVGFTQLLVDASGILSRLRAHFLPALPADFDS